MCIYGKYLKFYLKRKSVLLDNVVYKLLLIGRVNICS